MHRYRAEFLTVIKLQAAVGDGAKTVSLLQNGVEHWREIARRGVDDPKHLSGRSLLVQGVARLRDETRILHRDDRLRREVLQQPDLLVRKWLDLLAVDH